MKLTELKKNYAEAKATSVTRELLNTVTTDIIQAGRTDEGFAYVQTKDPIKVLVDGEFRETNRIVLFKEDEDEFKGAYAPTADIIMLNGLKTPKAKITVEAYENADGEAALTHSVRILLNSQDVAELERKALKYGKQVQAQPIAANPFE